MENPDKKTKILEKESFSFLMMRVGKFYLLHKLMIKMHNNGNFYIYSVEKGPICLLLV